MDGYNGPPGEGRDDARAKAAGGRLRVPAPRARPGEAPDFGHLDLGEPGALARPPQDLHAHDAGAYADGLIRVLG